MAGELRTELEQLLNKHSRENESNTPDFILANFMLGCLATGEALIKEREKWYGVECSPGAVVVEPGKVISER